MGLRSLEALCRGDGLFPRRQGVLGLGGAEGGVRGLLRRPYGVALEPRAVD